MRPLIGAMALILLLNGPPATAANFGLAADNASKKVTVFSTDSDTVLGTVAIPTVGRLGDCAIRQDQTQAFVSDSTSSIWIIDLTQTPPRLARGVNPIPVSIHPQELALSNDQKYLLAAGSFLPEPISVVDLATRKTVSTFSTGGDCSALDVGADGTVLVASTRSNRIRSLALSSTGLLSDSGKFRPGKEPMNVYCSRDGKTGVAITYSPGTVASFTNPNLTTANIRQLTDNAVGICALLNPQGDRCFVRTRTGVDAFAFNSTTAVLGVKPLFHIPAPYSSNTAFYGMDQLAISGDGSRLYIGVAGALQVFSASNGTFLRSVTNGNAISQPTGIAIKRNLGPVAHLPTSFTVGQGTPVPIVANLFDADGDALSVTWSVDGGAPVQVDYLTGGGTSTAGTATLTRTYSLGQHTVTVTVSDENGAPTSQTVTFNILNTITITGTVFRDSNNNQRRDSGEIPLSNWRIYIDANNNGKWEATEPSQLTDGNGAFSLVVTTPGTYYVREVLPSGWKLTAPTSGYFKIVAAAGQSPVLLFGNRPG